MSFDPFKAMASNESSGVKVGMRTDSRDVRMFERSETDAGTLDVQIVQQATKQQADGIMLAVDPGISEVCNEQRIRAPFEGLDFLDCLRPEDGTADDAGFPTLCINQSEPTALPQVARRELGDVGGVHAAVERQQNERPQGLLSLPQNLSQFPPGELTLPVLGFVLSPCPTLFGGGGFLEGVTIPGLAFDQPCGFSGPPEHRTDGLDTVVQLPRAESAGPLYSNRDEVVWTQIPDTFELPHASEELPDGGIVVAPCPGLDLIHSLVTVAVGDDFQGRIGRHGRDGAASDTSSAAADQLDQFGPGSVFIGPGDVLAVDSLADTSIGSLGDAKGELAGHGRIVGASVGAKSRKPSKNNSSSDRTRTCDPGLMKPLADSAGRVSSGFSKEKRYSRGGGEGVSALNSWQKVGAVPEVSR